MFKSFGLYSSISFLVADPDSWKNVSPVNENHLHGKFLLSELQKKLFERSINFQQKFMFREGLQIRAKCLVMMFAVAEDSSDLLVVC